MTIETILVPIVKEIMTNLQKQLRESSTAQGHRLTGKLENSIQFTVEPGSGSVVGTMYMEDYGTFVEVGVKADRIPYGKGGGKRGGTSLYIQGLISFWEHRGLSGREAVGAAFATAKVHAREGMPTRASSRFSSTGERTGFIRTVLQKEAPGIAKDIEEKFGAKLELFYAQAFDTERTTVTL